MPSRPESAIYLVRAAARAAGLGERPDSELLTTFLAGDPAAFEALVRRHGPMVLRTCRTATRCEADADDAFQATFVLLHRKAASFRDRRSVAGWLFRVARRAAANARRASERRARREAAVRRPEIQPGPDATWRDACAVLHAELDRLPEAHRLPLVLCYLEGLSRDEAANRLGWSPDVFRGRLERGRGRLRVRLERRGLALSAGLLTAVAAEGLPPNLLKATLASAARPGERVAGLAVAATPTLGVKVFAGFALGAAVLVGTVVLGSRHESPPADPPAKERSAEAARPAPRPDLFGDPLPDGAVARLGTVRFSHGDGLRVIRYSPDGKSLVSVGNGWARVWDAESGAEIRQFPITRTGRKDEAVVSPDGNTLIHLQRGDRNDPLAVYDLTTGRELWTWSLPAGGGITYAYLRNALSPDGRLALVNATRGRRVFDTATGKELCQIGSVREVVRDGVPVHPDEEAVAFAGPDRVVTAVKGGPIEVWDARTGEHIRAFTPAGPAGKLVPSPDGKLVAIIDGDYTLQKDRLDPDVAQVWDLTTGKPVRQFEARPKSWYTGVAFSPDGRTLITATSSKASGFLTRWEVGTGRRVWEADGGGDLLTVSPDGKRLTTGAPIGRLTVRDLETGRVVSSPEPDYARAPGLHLSQTGDRVVTVGYRSISTWDGATGRRLQSFPLPYVPVADEAWRIASPRGRYAATLSRADNQATLHVFAVADGRELVRRPLGVPTSSVTVTFTPDESRVAVRLPGKEVSTIHVLDLASGKDALTIQDHRTWFPGTQFVTADGRALVVAGQRVVGYSLADGSEQFSYTIDANTGPGGSQAAGASDTSAGWRALALSPDGSLGCCVLSRGIGGPSTIPNRLLLFDGRTGRALHRWPDSDRGGRMGEVLSFSADGRLVASSDGNDVHLWEAATGRKVRTFQGHRGEMETLAFSGNGRRLASASWDGTVLIWDLFDTSTGDPALAWADLAGDDAAAAWSAIWRLADAADGVTLPLLRKYLKPLTAADRDWIARLGADLDSDDFRVRDRASRELADVGYDAKPALFAARAKGPSAEAAARLDQLIAKLSGPPSSGESLRTWRALAVLEILGTPEARTFLAELAGGADGWLTDEAKAALKQLAR